MLSNRAVPANDGTATFPVAPALTVPASGTVHLLATLDLAGRKVTCFQHVRADTPLILLPLVRADATVSIAAVNPDSTDDAAAAVLAASGVSVWAWSRDLPGVGIDFRR